MKLTAMVGRQSLAETAIPWRTKDGYKHCKTHK